MSQQMQDYLKNWKSSFLTDISHYKVIAKIGSGTHGEVFKAKDEDGRPVALKKILMQKETQGFPITAIREIKLLQELKHDNIVDLVEICRSRSSQSPCCLPGIDTFFLVMEFCDHDLAGLIANRKLKFSLGEIKKVMYQLFNGLYHIHQNRIVHRDMKPANILITKEGVLKLADFGLGRPLMNAGQGQASRYTGGMVTLWYRPPEILLGQRDYGQPIDMWSAGCIMAEMWTRCPIMKGTSEQQQISYIIQLCGSFTEYVWPGVTQIEGFNKLELPKDHNRKVKARLKTQIPHATALDLVDRLLTLDPASRIDADTALDHEFFWTDPLAVNLKGMLSQLNNSMRENQAPSRRAVVQHHATSTKSLLMKPNRAILHAGNDNQYHDHMF
jgi:cyclin-dependent kinase 9